MDSALNFKLKIDSALKKHGDLVDQVSLVNGVITQKRDQCELTINTLLRSFGETLMNELNQRFECKQVYIARLMMAIHSMREDLEVVIGQLQATLSITNDTSEFAAMQARLLEKLNNKIAELDAFQAFSMEQAHILDFICSENLDAHSIGYIQTSLVSPQELNYHVTVKSDSKIVYLGDMISIKVQASVSFYDPLMFDSLTCIVESPTGQTSVKGKVVTRNSTTEYTYEYSYKTECTGNHTIKVLLFGEDISQSPSCFEVFTRPEPRQLSSSSILNSMRGMNNMMAGAMYSQNYMELTGTNSSNIPSNYSIPETAKSSNINESLSTSSSLVPTPPGFPPISTDVSSSTFSPQKEYRYVPSSSMTTNNIRDLPRLRRPNATSHDQNTSNINHISHLPSSMENTPAGSLFTTNGNIFSPETSSSRQFTDTAFFQRNEAKINFGEIKSAGGLADISVSIHNDLSTGIASGDCHGNIPNSFDAESCRKLGVPSFESSGCGRGRGVHAKTSITNINKDLNSVSELKKSIEHCTLKATSKEFKMPDALEIREPSPDMSAGFASVAGLAPDVLATSRSVSSPKAEQIYFPKSEHIYSPKADHIYSPKAEHEHIYSPKLEHEDISSAKAEREHISPSKAEREHISPSKAECEHTFSQNAVYEDQFSSITESASNSVPQHRIFWSDVDCWKMSGQEVKATFMWKSNSNFRFPIGVAPTPDDNIVVCDTGHHKVVILNNEGKIVTTFGKEGSGNGEFRRPSAVVVLDDSRIVIKDDHKLQIFSSAGEYLTSCRNVSFKKPFGLAKDGQGRLVMLDVGNPPSLYFFNQEGDLLSKAPYQPLSQPNPNSKCRFMDVDDRHVVVVDLGLACVYLTDFGGNLLHYFGSPGRREGQFRDPAGISIDKDHNMFVADSKNSRVQVFNSKCQFLTFVNFLDQPIHRPSDICLTRTGKLLVLNYTNHCLAAYDLQC